MSTGLYDTRIQGLKEQKALARKLRQQAASETPQGQMVSGWYVAPSWTQNMANALRQGFAAYDEGKASREADRLEKQKESETNAVMGQLYSNYQSPQAQPEQGFFDKLINGEQQAPQQAPADLQANPNLDQNQRLAAMLRGSMVNPEVFAPMLDMEQHRMTTDEARANHQAALEERKLARQDAMQSRADALAQRQLEHQDNMDLKRQNMENTLALRQATAANRPEKMINTIDPTSGQVMPMPQSQVTSDTPIYHPAVAKQIQDKLFRAKSKDEFQSTLSDMGAEYDSLNKLGGLKSNDNSALNNATMSIQQKAGDLFGTEAGTSRQNIEGIRQDLLQKFKNATGLSASQMNSDKELSAVMKALTDPSLTYEAAQDQMNYLSKHYGNGQALYPDRLRTKAAQAPAQAPAQSMANKNANGWELHVDGQGRRAYVNPQNPSQYEVVK